jgi:two-component system, OmpR family, phosphate regulon sensor histidine kinase PhoR
MDRLAAFSINCGETDTRWRPAWSGGSMSSRRRSLGWTITLGVVMIVLLVALTIGWVLLTGAARYWVVLAIGTVFLVLVLLGVVLYLVLSIKEIRLNQRQANFIDSVTHELKSPLASLKLYVQTLERRRVSEEQQSEFLRFMLRDLDRLDMLINHLLDAARVDQAPSEGEVEDVELSKLLRNCAETACQRYRLPAETVRLDVAPTVVRGRPIDVEMVFRNLIDNAVKYSGDVPEVQVESHANGNGRIITRISDNGRGIPASLRRKIFGRFVRLGSELERSKQGTGLGLYIVRTLVRRLRGDITLRSRIGVPGTTFEVELPGRAETATSTTG